MAAIISTLKKNVFQRLFVTSIYTELILTGYCVNINFLTSDRLYNCHIQGLFSKSISISERGVS